MSWFNKRTRPAVPAPQASSSRTSKPALDEASEDTGKFLDAALDAAGAIVRTFGKYSFSLEETTSLELAERYERWARHVLNGAPAPDGSEPQRGRAWRPLQLEFTERRKAESEHVRRVRELIWVVMNGVRGALSHDAVADARLREPLEKLRKVISSDATMAELRSEVGAAVAVIEQTLADRQVAQLADFSQMAATVREAKGELLATHGDGEIDLLTQVFTRVPLNLHLENSASVSDFTGEPLSLLLVDGDNFKKLNEAIGRESGDRVLKSLADSCVRVAARNTDYVARFGGDEFAVVLGDTSLADAVKVAERIVEAARKLNSTTRPGERNISVSVGVAQRRRFETCPCWLERASRALVTAQGKGRDQVSAAQED